MDKFPFKSTITWLLVSLGLCVCLLLLGNLRIAVAPTVSTRAVDAINGFDVQGKRENILPAAGLDNGIDRIPRGVKQRDDWLREQVAGGSLSLRGTDADDELVSRLAALQESTDLRIVDLSSTHITDRSVGSLSLAKRLRELLLADTELTDSAIGVVTAQFPQLECLDLSGTGITDSCVLSLRKLKSLRWLDLRGACITDNGINDLAGIRNLRWLNISSTSISDFPWNGDVGFQDLEGLNLSSTDVSDRTLQSLRKLGKLRILIVENTQITEGAVNRFIVDRPEVTVKYSKNKAR